MSDYFSEMVSKKQYDRVRLILGDQLNATHSWFNTSTDSDSTLYIIAELQQETSYVQHHQQKVLAFFCAMENFAVALKKANFNVLHLTLDDTVRFKTLPEFITQIIETFNVTHFEYQQPDEYRLSKQMSDLARQLTDQGFAVSCEDSEHFLLKHDEISLYFTKDKNQRMETFYRKMRKRHDILMQSGEPLGQQWNFDKENRKKLTLKDINDIPEPLLFANNVSKIQTRLTKHNVKMIGDASSQLLWPVNRTQAMQLLHYFCETCLPRFGLFQDAMTRHAKDAFQDNQWSLYHSRLSFALNSKILSPKLVVDTAIQYYQNNESINLAQIEGFVRQIIGWREFVRGIYWTHMPEYSAKNELDADQKMPSWFWSGVTKMNCMKHAITQSLDYAYAHHIQRLMVTGNFCLIAGISPDEVDRWYLGIYIDAIEWVELPNTRGMSQFADGGILGSKPYAASGNYINKMSDYCSDCEYKVKEKATENACPFNSLYWQFMVKHRDKLGKNPRTSMVYKNWDKQSSDSKEATLSRAKYLSSNLEKL